MKNILANSIAANDCLGVILAGGLSTRMGKDKAGLTHHTSVSMLEFSKQTLKNSGLSEIVVSGDNYDIPDKINKSGPVGGILSVLSKHPYVKSLLILPVDLPFMTSKALTDLRIKGELSQKATFFEGHSIPLYLPNNSYVELFLKQVITQQKSAKYHNPTSGLHQPSSSKKNGPSIKALLSHVPHKAIQNNDASILFNANTPEQWQQAQAQFKL